MLVNRSTGNIQFMDGFSNFDIIKIGGVSAKSAHIDGAFTLAGVWNGENIAYVNT